MYSLLKKLKKLTAFLTAAMLCLLLPLFLAGCQKANAGALTLDGVEISNDVLKYFVDAAFCELGDGASQESVTARAVELCSSYFKKNTLAHSENTSLSQAQKAGVSEKVNAYWGVYKEYYASIGITKETLTKVFTADAYRDALLIHYYGEGGENEVGVARLYAAFRTNYVVFRSVSGYFTYVDQNGLTQYFDEPKKEALILKFQNMASLINAGEKTMEEAAEFLAETGYTSSVITAVLKRGESGYPEGFFEKVQSLEARKASVIGTTEYIFLISRGDAGTDSEFYLDKRDEILKEIVGDEIDIRIENAFSPEPVIDESKMQAVFLTVKSERSGI